jgi:hypothetical protein
VSRLVVHDVEIFVVKSAPPAYGRDDAGDVEIVARFELGELIVILKLLRTSGEIFHELAYERKIGIGELRVLTLHLYQRSLRGIVRERMVYRCHFLQQLLVVIALPER